MELRLIQMQPTHHREYGRFVVVIHLDLRDVGTSASDIVNNRVGQSNIVWANSCDNYFHGVPQEEGGKRDLLVKRSRPAHPGSSGTD
jgi:hypothetical protein